MSDQFEVTIVAWGDTAQLAALARLPNASLPYPENDPTLSYHGTHVTIWALGRDSPQEWLEARSAEYDELFWLVRWANSDDERGVYGLRGAAALPWWAALESAPGGEAYADALRLCLAALPPACTRLIRRAVSRCISAANADLPPDDLDERVFDGLTCDRP